MANDTPKPGGSAPKAADLSQNGPSTKAGPTATKDTKIPNNTPIGGATAPKDTRPPKTEKAPQEGKKSNGPNKAAPAKDTTPPAPGKTDKAAPVKDTKPPAPGKAGKAAPAPPKDAKKPAAKAASDKTVPFPRKGKDSPGKQEAKKQLADTPAPKAAKAPEKQEPTMEELRAKMEADLRKEFNIPKSEKPVEPWVAPEKEEVIRLPHEQIHPFKDHSFTVDTTAAKFLALTASVRAHGVSQPAIVRPREGGGYEMVSGHRRDAASMAAEIPYTPCIVRNLNDEQAIQQMVEDNLTSRDITTMELARALKKQLDSIKHQGARQAIEGGELTDADSVGKRSNAIVAERNGMSVKQVQRYVALNNLIAPLQDYLDEGKAIETGKAQKIAFVTAVELSALKPENQEYVALAIEAEQATPNTAQAKEIRTYEKQGYLNMNDVIDGVLKQEKKEAINVTLSGAELEKYFGKGKHTPREMKEKILEALDKAYPAQQREAAKPDKKQARTEK